MKIYEVEGIRSHEHDRRFALIAHAIMHVLGTRKERSLSECVSLLGANPMGVAIDLSMLNRTLPFEYEGRIYYLEQDQIITSKTGTL